MSQSGGGVERNVDYIVRIENGNANGVSILLPTSS